MIFRWCCRRSKGNREKLFVLSADRRKAIGKRQYRLPMASNIKKKRMKLSKKGFCLALVLAGSMAVTPSASLQAGTLAVTEASEVPATQKEYRLEQYLQIGPLSFGLPAFRNTETIDGKAFGNASGAKRRHRPARLASVRVSPRSSGWHRLATTREAAPSGSPPLPAAGHRLPPPCR